MREREREREYCDVFIATSLTHATERDKKRERLAVSTFFSPQRSGIIGSSRGAVGSEAQYFSLPAARVKRLRRISTELDV